MALGGRADAMLYPLVAGAIAVAGLLVGGVLLYLDVIGSTNREVRELFGERTRSTLAAAVTAEVQDQARRVRAMAGAPAVRAALGAGDDAPTAAADGAAAPLERQALERLLTDTQAGVAAVWLVPPDRDPEDHAEGPPLTFTARSMIRRARAGEAVPPEYVPGDGGGHVHHLATVPGAGAVPAVVLAYFDTATLRADLDRLMATDGVVVLQQIVNRREVAIVRVESRDRSGAAVDVSAANPLWRLLVDLEPGALPTPVAGAQLLLPLAVALVAILAGLALGFLGLLGAVRSDARHLGAQAGDGEPRTYRLRALADVAAALSALPRRARTPEPARTAGAADRAGAAGSTSARDRDAEAPGSGSPFGLAAGIEVTEENDEPIPPPKADPSTMTAEASPGASAPELDPRIFRAYDIRGVVGKDLTPEVAVAVGRAVGSESRSRGENTVCVGGDGRLSSPELRTRMIEGLRASGCDVIDVGEVPTPLLYFATCVLDGTSGVMITGSHNPPEYNGFKIVVAGETLAGDGIQRLRERIEQGDLLSGDGAVTQVELVQRYIDRVAGDIVIAQPLRVVVDCGNGVAGNVAPALIEALGCEVIPMYCDVDGTFPNHHPDPAEPENLEELIARVKAEGADLGLAFDGDGDRLGIVTNEGDIIWPDRALMLFCRDIVGRNPGADVIFDVKCSRHLNDVIAEYGGRPIMWKTGHSHIKAKIKETGALIGGEFSGHIAFLERWYGFDDGLYSAARLLEIVGAETQTVADLFRAFPDPLSTPEIKVRTTEDRKFEVMNALADSSRFAGATLTTIDGVRADYATGWGLIRASNTSPVLTLRFEADDEATLQQVQQTFRDALRDVDPELDFEPQGAGS
jgi:phosphomannomutase/phosphoglucomutase